MKAMVCTAYGAPDVLKLQEVVKPIPKDREIRIKIYATTVNSGDCRVRGFRSPLLYRIPMRLVLGLRKPRQPILGVELAGEVEAIGKDVTRFKVGDQVLAFRGMRFGTYAQYICMREDAFLLLKPDQVTYDDAAAVSFGGTTALHFLRKGNIRQGHKVLIYGASGAVGTLAVQLAKQHYGAEVTGVCSTANVGLVRSLGADRVIDYTKEDFTTSGARYDIILDAVGKLRKSRCKHLLTQGESYVTVEGQGVAKVLMEDLRLLVELLGKGKIRPVIDRRYALEQMAEAHRYVDEGRKRGSVVITVGHDH
ncbi:NAD(P)-dependent alcohol dehydrogenase [Paenibacillus sp. EZ-K15]|uniref:NAD(P)-dependent alcohol dehydrogenase n=1 Tax=Paenibacillus sp. EZ-K15 TaxID=2044275 RepID=UPI000BF4DF0B|nr:NAD(P)-dependent alcohol dehydrogenase [Paenibacillus sp. EZ-K15]